MPNANVGASDPESVIVFSFYGLFPIASCLFLAKALGN